MSLIGFSGKIGSGKDLAAQMVQYLNFQKLYPFDNLSFDVWEEMYTDTERARKSRIEIEKFGGKLKDIVCVLLNCDRCDLEDREFKDKELKKWVKYVLSWTDKYSDCTNTKTFLSHGEAQNFIDDQNVVYFYDIDRVQLTPRLLLQLIGTECGRNIIHPNIWVTATLEPYMKQLRWIKMDHGNRDKFSSWVISDVRFPNEVTGIEKLDGIVIRINRETEKAKSSHESETALDNYEFEYVIDNNGTKAELLDKIRNILEISKIN